MFFMMRRSFFAIILILSASLVPTIAQVLEAKPQAIKFDSFEQTSIGVIELSMDGFFIEMSTRDSGTSGVVVSYGPKRTFDERQKFLMNYVRFHRFDRSRITYVRGGNVNPLRTDLWIIPNGSDPPNIEPEAYIETEFGRITKAKAVRIVRNYFGELDKNWNSQGYIINYGTNAEIALREKWITSALSTRKDDRSRITLVRGGRSGGLRTVMWVVPPGAANPKP